MMAARLRRSSSFSQTAACRTLADGRLDRQSTLPHGGADNVRRYEFGYTVLPAQAVETCGRQHDGIVMALVELAQPCIHVAAQRFDAQIRPERAQLRGAPQ